MKKVALVFVVAVLVPSLVLAWLAVRSLRDQEFVFERQQELLYQGTADSFADKIRGFLDDQQREFDAQVEALLSDQNPRAIATQFDEKIRANWRLAEIGFSVTLDGSILAPQMFDAQGRRFRTENGSFLSNAARAEVYGQQGYSQQNAALV